MAVATNDTRQVLEKEKFAYMFWNITVYNWIPNQINPEWEGCCTTITAEPSKREIEKGTFSYEECACWLIFKEN